MAIEEFLQRSLKDLERAKEHLKDAETLIKIGEKAGIDVSAQRAEADMQRERIKALEEAIKEALVKK